LTAVRRRHSLAHRLSVTRGSLNITIVSFTYPQQGTPYSTSIMRRLHSGLLAFQCFSHWFVTVFTDSFKLMSLTDYCLQRVQFHCMLYVTDSPCFLSQNTLKSSIMFISDIYKQYNEVDDLEVAILFVFGARSSHFRFGTQPIYRLEHR